MIYFMQDSGSLNVKIGFTASQEALAAETRRKQLQTGNPSRLVVLATMPGTEQDEARLHRQFDAHCVGGEWFRPAPEVLALIGQARADAAEVAGTVVIPLPLRFYFAGKMTRGAWRETLLCEEASYSCEEDDSLFLNHDPADYERLPVIKGGVLRGCHDYVGPYYFETTGGHGTFTERQHGFNDWPPEDFAETHNHAALRRLCLDAIRRADVVFCWLDSTDCHGTLAEVGYAHALGRRIWAAGPQLLPDLWFAVGMAEWQKFPAPSPGAALREAIAWAFRMGGQSNPLQVEARR